VSIRKSSFIISCHFGTHKKHSAARKKGDRGATAMPSFAQRAAKVASKQPDQPEEEVEMFANGVAFDVVKGWLGTEGKDLQFAEWFGVEDVDCDRPKRQERLGLGAKFLSHDKAQRLHGAVQTKLGKALGRSQARRREEEEEEETEGKSAAGNHRNGDDDSDSDDGGRAGVSFARNEKQRAGTR